MNTLFAAEKAVSEVASGGAGGSTMTTVAARAHRNAAMSALEAAEKTADSCTTIEALRVEATNAAKMVIIAAINSGETDMATALSDKLYWESMVAKCRLATCSATSDTFKDKPADEIITVLATAIAHRDDTATAYHEAVNKMTTALGSNAYMAATMQTVLDAELSDKNAAAVVEALELIAALNGLPMALEELNSTVAH
jgi:hypothetical protein